MGGRHSGRAAHQNAAAAELVEHQAGAEDDGEAAGNLRHRGQDRRVALLVLDGFETDCRYASCDERRDILGPSRREPPEREDGLVAREHRELFRVGRVDAGQQLRAQQALHPVEDDQGAGGLVVAVRVAGFRTGAALEVHLVPGLDQGLDRRWREGHPSLVRARFFRYSQSHGDTLQR